MSTVAALLVLLLTNNAAAGDFPSLRFKTPAVCTTEGGSTVSLPPGRFMPEPEWIKLDDKWKLMEDRVTRLSAENKSLRSSDASPGWKSAATGVIVGIMIGRYALDQ